MPMDSGSGNLCFYTILFWISLFSLTSHVFVSFEFHELSFREGLCVWHGGAALRIYIPISEEDAGTWMDSKRFQLLFTFSSKGMFSDRPVLKMCWIQITVKTRGHRTTETLKEISRMASQVKESFFSFSYMRSVQNMAG